jgi:hypothetical protein
MRGGGGDSGGIKSFPPLLLLFWKSKKHFYMGNLGLFSYQSSI